MDYGGPESLLRRGVKAAAKSQKGKPSRLRPRPLTSTAKPYREYDVTQGNRFSPFIILLSSKCCLLVLDSIKDQQHWWKYERPVPGHESQVHMRRMFYRVPQYEGQLYLNHCSGNSLTTTHRNSGDCFIQCHILMFSRRVIVTFPPMFFLFMYDSQFFLFDYLTSLPFSAVGN